MMKKLIEKVEDLGAFEYSLASEQHGATFNSAHEGFAVMREEYDELDDEVDKLLNTINSIWKDIRNDDLSVASLIRAKYTARNAACEAIQVYAMLEKMIQTEEQKNATETM